MLLSGICHIDEKSRQLNCSWWGVYYFVRILFNIHQSSSGSQFWILENMVLISAWWYGLRVGGVINSRDICGRKWPHHQMGTKTWLGVQYLLKHSCKNSLQDSKFSPESRAHRELSKSFPLDTTSKGFHNPQPAKNTIQSYNFLWLLQFHFSVYNSHFIYYVQFFT